MGISTFDQDVNVISKLADKPNETNNLTADQLKAMFDKAPGLIKAYLNGTMIPELAKEFEDIAERFSDQAKNFEALSMATKNAENLTEGTVSSDRLPIVPVEKGGTGNEEGLAKSSEKLKTARSFLVDLESEESDSFDGTEDAKPGITGVLPMKHGGLGADNAQEGLKNLGGASIKKLWENASQASSFANQTITISGLQDYDKIIVIARYSIGSFDCGMMLVDTTIGAQASVLTGISYISWRSITIGDESVSFGYGEYRSVYGGTGYTDNILSIPVEIYGVKGVQ